MSDGKRLTWLPIVIPEAAEVKSRMSEIADVALAAEEPEEVIGSVVTDTPLIEKFQSVFLHQSVER